MVKVFNTVQEQLTALAEYFVSNAQNSISLHGEFNVALSGGNSPEKLYEMLASPGFNQQVDWNKINFFFNDERFVPSDHQENNARMVKRALFDPLNISPSKIFSINTSLSPAEAAKKYTEAIATHFKDQKARFDLILLGLGDNAHTASLFPFNPVLADRSASVKAVFLEQQNVYRITMTAPLINQARHIAFLVYGREKAEAVRNVLESGPEPEKYPAQLIHPEQGDLQWFLDETSASRLKSF